MLAFSENPELSSSRSHRRQPNPNSRLPSLRACFWECEARSFVSKHAMQLLRTSQKSPWCHESSCALSLLLPGSGANSRAAQEVCASNASFTLQQICQGVYASPSRTPLKQVWGLARKTVGNAKAKSRRSIVRTQSTLPKLIRVLKIAGVMSHTFK